MRRQRVSSRFWYKDDAIDAVQCGGEKGRRAQPQYEVLYEAGRQDVKLGAGWPYCTGQVQNTTLSITPGQCSPPATNK
jgi:hypothetical protein